MNLSELKLKAKELSIKGYSKLKKDELEKLISAKENELLEKEKWIKYILNNGDKKYEIERGMAKHVDECPIKIRIYRGKSYANTIDDCPSCEFLLGVSENLGNYSSPEQYLICGGKKGIKKKFDWIDIPFNRSKYIEKNSKKYKHLYECNVCGKFYFDQDIFNCDYTNKKILSTYVCNICGSNRIKKIT